MTLADALQAARAAGVSRLEASRLLEAVTGSGRARQLAYPETRLNSRQQQHWQQLLAQRSAGTPLAHLLGEQGFMDMQLTVSPDVLIPRPETEHLVELALELPLAENSRMIDLGTGSGAVALALARNRPQWLVLATDISAAALTIAQRNIDRWAPGRVQAARCHWLEPLAARSLDLIVSNPPYVAVDDPDLAMEVAAHEPATALYAGADGLDAVREIVAGAKRVLIDDGWLLLEHGSRQAPEIRSIMVAAGFQSVRSRQDYAGHDRVTLGQH